jgi:hypothetical protein
MAFSESMDSSVLLQVQPYTGLPRKDCEGVEEPTCRLRVDFDDFFVNDKRALEDRVSRYLKLQRFF